MFPVAIAVNISYLLPVSTPCNAIVYAYGDIKVSDMVRDRCIAFFAIYWPLLHTVIDIGARIDNGINYPVEKAKIRKYIRPTLYLNKLPRISIVHVW